MSDAQEKSCGCIVFHKGPSNYPRFLIVRDVAHGNWGFPKGHIEEGETEIETALRETKEETGLDVKIIDGFRKEIEYTMNTGDKKTAVYFLAQSDTIEVELQKTEIDKHAWMTTYEALGRVTFINAALFVQDARNFLKAKKLTK